MGTSLKSIVNFKDLAVGATLSKPHGLNVNGFDAVPDVVSPGRGASEVDVTADALNVTATNNGAALASFDVLVEHWHTIERDFGDVALLKLAPQPFVVGGAGGEDVVEDASLILHPFDPLGQRGNIFVTWESVYDAIVAIRASGYPGAIYLNVITDLCPPNADLFGDPTFTVPAAPALAHWDLSQVVLANPPQTACNITFATDCFIDNFRTTDGNGMKLVGTAMTSPFNECLLFMRGPRTDIWCAPGAAPLFVVNDGFGLIEGSGADVFGTVGIPNNFFPTAPCIDLNGAFFEFAGVNGGDDFFIDSSSSPTIAQVQFSAVDTITMALSHWSFPSLNLPPPPYAMDFQPFFFFPPGVPRRRLRSDGFPITATPYTASFNAFEPMDTSAVAPTVNLPTAVGASGESIIVFDESDNASVNNITINALPGENINGSPSLVINNDSGCVTLLSNSIGGWCVVARV